jgi:CHASE2 domain-containing sensor protein
MRTGNSIPAANNKCRWLPAIITGGVFAAANFVIMAATLNSKEILDPISYGVKALIFSSAALLMAFQKNRSGIFLLALGGGLCLLLDGLFLAAGYIEITIGSGIIPLIFAVIAKKKLKPPPA